METFMSWVQGLTFINCAPWRKGRQRGGGGEWERDICNLSKKGKLFPVTQRRVETSQPWNPDTGISVYFTGI